MESKVFLDGEIVWQIVVELVGGHIDAGCGSGIVGHFRRRLSGGAVATQCGGNLGADFRGEFGIVGNGGLGGIASLAELGAFVAEP